VGDIEVLALSRAALYTDLSVIDVQKVFDCLHVTTVIFNVHVCTYM